MKSRILSVAALFSVCASSLAAQGTASVSGAFVTRLGSDTLSVERYTRSGDKLVGDLLMRNPRARIFHYVADLAPNGTIKAMTVNVRPVTSDSASPPAMSVTTLFADTVATLDVARAGVPDTVATGKKIYHGLVVPQVNFAPASYAVYEEILRTAKLTGSDSVGYAVIAPGRNPAPTIWLSKRGRDSVV